MQEHRRDQKTEAAVALITTSDTRTLDTDETGRKAIELLEGAGHRIISHVLVENDINKIREAFEVLTYDDRIRVIITSGGTGVGKRDVTVDAISAYFDKHIEGFGELFRRLSYDEIGVTGVMSRTTAGIVNRKVVFCLPGSKQAMALALNKIILPSLGHTLWELNR